MTKISCEECRARLGEVLASDITLGNGDVESATLRAHLGACPACARDFQILQSARAITREFSAPPAPSDLRARVRAQLEPLVHAQQQDNRLANNGAASTAVAGGRLLNTFPTAHLAALPHTHNRRDVRDSWDRYFAFFRRPLNVAWVSGLALAAFCVLIFVHPDSRDPAFDEPDSTFAPGIVESKKPQTTQGAAKRSMNLSAAAAPTLKATPRIPGVSLPALTPLPSAALPSDFPYATAKLPPLPSTLGTEVEAKKSPYNSAAQNPRTSLAAPDALARGGVAQLPAPAIAPLQKRAVDRYATAPLSAASRTEEQNARREYSLATATSNARAEKPMMAAASSPSPQTMKAGAVRPAVAADELHKSNRDREDKDETASTPLTRFVEARITPARDVSWGQVSVVLSDGAHFSDGGKSRVLWRGTAIAGEAIEFGFSVAAPRGSYSAHLALQEVRNGDAQTVNSKQLPITVR